MNELLNNEYKEEKKEILEKIEDKEIEIEYLKKEIMERERTIENLSRDLIDLIKRNRKL